MSKNLRMQGWDFTSPGGYFVTICTKRMQPVFGTVVNGHMHLNDAGKIAEAFWREIPEHFPHVIVDEYVIMPDHVHGLLHIPTACRAAIDEGRLLLISPFSDKTQAPNARRASWCNQFAVSLAERMIIGHLNPEGMLACILSEADPDKEIIIL